MAALLAPSTAWGQITHVAPQASYGDGARMGVGLRLAFDLPGLNPGLEPQVGFELFFPDDEPGVDVGYMEVNANLIYAFRLRATSVVSPYAGGGFNIARTSRERSGTPFVADASEAKIGVNVIGGLRVDLAGFAPFVEARLEIGGGDQAVVTGGVRIPM